MCPQSGFCFLVKDKSSQVTVDRTDAVLLSHRCKGTRWWRCLLMSVPRCLGRWALFQRQNKSVIWQNIQQWSYLIIWFTTLLFSLLWCRRSLSSALSLPRMTQKKWLYLCLRFPCPPLGKSLSFGDLNVVIVHLILPFAYYPNILWRCWFYDFLVHLLLELDFYSQKKFKFSFTKSL